MSNDTRTPAFSVGYALGGINVSNNGTGFPIDSSGSNINVDGPLFKNMIYSAYQNQKDIEIVYCATRHPKFQQYTYEVRISPYYIFPLNGYLCISTNADHTSPSASFPCNEDSEIKIIIDTYNRKIKIYIDDTLVSDEFSVDDAAFSYSASDIGGYWFGGYFWLVFPSYNGNIPDTGPNNWPQFVSKCTLHYLRLYLNSWET